METAQRDGSVRRSDDAAQVERARSTGWAALRRGARRASGLITGLLLGLATSVVCAGNAWASTALGAAPLGPTSPSGGTPPGLTVVTGLTGWIAQYGWVGAPFAISIGGLLMAVEHHQQRTGNVVRAKGYITAAAAGLIVISLATSAVGLFHQVLPSK